VSEGHPYRTDALVQTRAEQRRLLRSIPDWIVDNVRLSPPAPRLGDPDDALVERELRRLATRELEQLDGWLDAWQAHAEAELVRRWFERVEIGAALEDVAGAVREADEAARVVDYPPGLFPVVLRVVALLAWADELAADYADPRLRRYHAAWRVPEPPPAPRRPPAGRVDAEAFWGPPVRRGPARDTRPARSHPRSGPPERARTRPRR
jgi:hypothetical protein